ncbi:metal-dependent hydrolase [Alphaproteobacteria bacterium]|nr:metal-dependent hydrolase [Alphaproteobacteria bacterium]MDC1023285.1 metal-dependent hydrolase [Alphaproteobacteria bacterium]
MDPVSQGAFGAIFAQTISNKKKLVAGSILGCLAGLAPDLDVLIRSNSDPLLKLEFHRQFTHSLVFIPIGALIVALFTRFFFKRHLNWKESYLFCLFGYASHGLLDACTSYGTQLFWPFSNERISWNNISVVDPFLTVPIIIFIIVAIIRNNKFTSFLGIIYIFLFLGMGVIQKNRAEEAGKYLANIRGHKNTKLTVKPSLGNLLLWKVIYEDNGFYYVDAVRLFLEKEHCQGTSIKKLNTFVDFGKLRKDSQQYKDIKRFKWFSQDYLGVGEDKTIITDVRYSAVPNEVDGLWGIKINPEKNKSEHAEWVVNRSEYTAKGKKFLDLLLGKGCKIILHEK